MPKLTWTTSQEQFLREHYLTMTHKEMAAILGKTDTAVKAKCGKMRLIKPDDLKKALLLKHSIEANRHKMLTAEEDELVKENYLSIPIKSLAKVLNKGETAIRGSLKRQGLVIPQELANYRKEIGMKRKGNIPFNKGLPQISYMSPESIERSRASRFKKGSKPHNIVQIGSETLTKGGYIKVKIGEPNKWIFKQRLIWQQHFGEIPDNHIIIFKDNDILNFDINNLQCIKREQNVRRKCISEKYEMSRNNLTDEYVADVIKRRTPLNREDIPKSLIELKRTQLKINRELKKLNQNESK